MCFSPLFSFYTILVNFFFSNISTSPPQPLELRLRVSIVCTSPEFARPNRTRRSAQSQSVCISIEPSFRRSTVTCTSMFKIFTFALLAMSADAFAPSPRPPVSAHSTMIPLTSCIEILAIVHYLWMLAVLTIFIHVSN